MNNNFTLPEDTIAPKTLITFFGQKHHIVFQEVGKQTKYFLNDSNHDKIIHLSSGSVLSLIVIKISSDSSAIDCLKKIWFRK